MTNPEITNKYSKKKLFGIFLLSPLLILPAFGYLVLKRWLWRYCCFEGDEKSIEEDPQYPGCVEYSTEEGEEEDEEDSRLGSKRKKSSRSRREKTQQGIQIPNVTSRESSEVVEGEEGEGYYGSYRNSINEIIFGDNEYSIRKD